MTLADFYAIEGILIGIMGAYFLVRPFFNRTKIYQVSEKNVQRLKFLEDKFEEAKKYVDKTNAKYVNRKESDMIEWLEGAVDLLHAGYQRTAAEIRLIDYDFSLRDLLGKRFEFYVKKDAVKGFVIIAIGVSLEIVSIMIQPS